MRPPAKRSAGAGELTAHTRIRASATSAATNDWATASFRCSATALGRSLAGPLQALQLERVLLFHALAADRPVKIAVSNGKTSGLRWAL